MSGFLPVFYGLLKRHARKGVHVAHSISIQSANRFWYRKFWLYSSMHRDLIGLRQYDTVLQGQQNTTCQLPGAYINIVLYTYKYECCGT